MCRTKYSRLFLDWSDMPSGNQIKGSEWLIIRNYNEFTRFIIREGLPFEISVGFIPDADKIAAPSRIAKFIIGYAMKNGADLAHLTYNVHCLDTSEIELVDSLFHSYYNDHYPNMKSW